MNAGAQVIEDFWGLELSKTKKEIKWEIEENDSEDSFFTDRSLELRQACLGASAKEGERNVVQLTTENDEGDEVSHTILSMRVGATEQTTLFLTLKPPVKFELVQGNGPIHLVGQINETIDLSALSSDEEEEEEDDKVPSGNIEKAGAISSRKRPAGSPALTSGPFKVPKMEDDDMEDDDDDDDEDTDEDEESEDDEEDDEEEDEVPPQVKKPQTNGKLKSKETTKKNMFKTPQPHKQASKVQKGSLSVPTTPKSAASDKKKPSGKGGPDINEIKQRLTKMSVPKKMEKFNNFVANSFKIKDDSIKKQLWEFVQKKKQN